MGAEGAAGTGERAVRSLLSKQLFPIGLPAGIGLGISAASPARAAQGVDV